MPSERSPFRIQPLDDLRVLAVEQYGAGPFGTLLMADLGAEVIKIENPLDGGDVSRYIPPYQDDRDSLFYQAFNRNKRSIGLNLKRAEGREVLHRLVEASEVVFSNMRGDQPERLQITYDHLKKYNPKIVCCNLSGYGMDGPRHDEPGYDYLIQALSGFMSLTGEPDTHPAKSGVSVVDFSTGFLSVIGMLTGLRMVDRTDRGCQVDVSLLETAISMLNYLATWHLNEDYEPERLPYSAHPTVVPSQLFETSDGYVVIMCQKQKFWEAFCQLMGCEELRQDDRFRTMEDRLNHRDELIPLLTDHLRNWTTEACLSRLRGEVPCAPVQTLRQALQDPQVLARNMVVSVSHPEYGTLREVGNPLTISGISTDYETAPGLGQDTDEILTSLCEMDPETLKQYREEGIIM